MTIAAWNKKLPLDSSGRPSVPLHANNTTILARMATWTGSYPLSTTVTDTTSDFNHPVFFAKTTDPLFTVAQGTSGGAYEGPYTIRIPQAARPARGGDGHMCVVQPDGVTEYDLWDVTTTSGGARLVTLPSGGGTIYARGVGKTVLTGSGQNTGSGDATAAKFGLVAGPIRGEELANNRINHALWWTVQGHNNTFVFPALATGGSGGFDHANAPPMGARFFLDYSMAEVEALAIPRYRKTITHAMREYGAIVGDAGGSPIDLQPLSGTTYTALGKADPFRTYMTAQGVTGTVDWRTGVDYAGKLRVAAESVSSGAGTVVPGAIDRTGATDVTAAVQAWLAGLANGTTALFNGGTYRIEGTISLSGKTLTIDGGGATFKSLDAPTDTRAIWRFTDSTITILNMTIDGSYTQGGTHDPALQHAHAIDLRGTRVTASNITATDLAGDGFYFGLGTGPSSGSVLDCDVSRISRNAVSVVAGQDVLVERMETSSIGYIVFDCEPNALAGNLAVRCMFRNNILRSYYLGALSIVENATVTDISFVNNTIIGRGLKVPVGSVGPVVRPQRLVITGNVCDTAQAQFAFNIDNVDGVTITGNTVPMTSGVMAQTNQCTAVNVSGNSFPGGSGQLQNNP